MVYVLTTPICKKHEWARDHRHSSQHKWPILLGGDCSGIETCALALHRLVGVDRVKLFFSSDNNPQCRTFLAHNYNIETIYKDAVRDHLRSPRVNVYVNGACTQLMRSGVEYIAIQRPDCFVFENVANLAWRHKEFMTEILQRLQDICLPCGRQAYAIQWDYINSIQYLPQQRNRVYIIGCRVDKLVRPFVWPKPPLTKPTLKSFLGPNNIIQARNPRLTWGESNNPQLH